MSWYLWFLAGWFLLGAVLVVASVGQPREPITRESAAFSVVICALLILGLFAFGRS